MPADGATASDQAFKDEIFNMLGNLAMQQERTFFRKFIQGELSKQGLQNYYKHLYHECCLFVRLVSLVHANAERKDQREALGHNLVDEYGHGEPGMDHPSLAMHIGKRFGLTEEEIENHGIYPEVKEQFDRLRELAFSSFIEGLAVLVTVEADLPIRHKMMRDALIEKYGLAAADLKYYAEHMDGSQEAKAGGNYGGDDVHVGREVDIIVRYARTDEERARVRRAIETTFDVRSKLVRTLDANCGLVN